MSERHRAYKDKTWQTKGTNIYQWCVGTPRRQRGASVGVGSSFRAARLLPLASLIGTSDGTVAGRCSTFNFISHHHLFVSPWPRTPTILRLLVAVVDAVAIVNVIGASVAQNTLSVVNIKTTGENNWGYAIVLRYYILSFLRAHSILFLQA